MLRRARVPKLPPASASPRCGPLPKGKEVAAVLPRLAPDVVLYGFLAALWANCAVGIVFEILGRRVCGKGSSVEAVGIAVGRCCRFIMLASNHAIAVELANEQLAKKTAAVTHRWLPKGVKLAPLYASLPMLTLQILAITIQLHHEEGSLMWRVADVVFDLACLGVAVIAGVCGVPNLVILVMGPKVKDGDDKIHQ